MTQPDQTRESSDVRPPLAGEHWFEMTATLTSRRQNFESWIDRQIADFESRHADLLRASRSAADRG